MAPIPPSDDSDSDDSSTGGRSSSDVPPYSLKEAGELLKARTLPPLFLILLTTYSIEIATRKRRIQEQTPNCLVWHELECELSNFLRHRFCLF